MHSWEGCNNCSFNQVIHVSPLNPPIRQNAAFIRAGIYLPGSRYFSGWYSVSTNLGSSWTPLSSMSNEIPPAVGTVGAPLATAWVPAGFTGETPSPSPPAGGPPPPGCSDVPPSSDYTCAQQAAFGKCRYEVVARTIINHGRTFHGVALMGKNHYFLLTLWSFHLQRELDAFWKLLRDDLRAVPADAGGRVTRHWIAAASIPAQHGISTCGIAACCRVSSCRLPTCGGVSSPCRIATHCGA